MDGLGGVTSWAPAYILAVSSRKFSGFGELPRIDLTSNWAWANGANRMTASIKKHGNSLIFMENNESCGREIKFITYYNMYNFLSFSSGRPLPWKRKNNSKK